MNYFEWIVEDGVLHVISPADEKHVPTAEHLYGLIFKQRSLPAPFTSASTPTSSLADLKFSRYPADIHLCTHLTEVCGEYKIRCCLVITHDEKRMETSCQNLAFDHTVMDNCWYPFTHGAIDQIRAILCDAGIPESAEYISLRQYASLISRDSASDYLDDCVPDSINPAKNAPPSGMTTIPPFFNGQLYPYQATGFRWLKLVSREDAGCILGDEMGLGKTIQVIALLCSETAEKRGTSLVIAPVTLAENWRRELVRFAPELQTLIHLGASRTGFPSSLERFDVVITSYDTAVRDLSLFRMVNWNVVLLDEAQAIKNPEAKRTKTLKRIPRRVSIAVTGTPVENRLLDLWSISDFAFTGLLGTRTNFENEYGNQDIESARTLERRVSPILLRRKLEEVASDLPDKIDIPQVLYLDDAGASEYERLRTDIEIEYGKHSSLVALTKLRMFCTHPFLLNDQGGDPKCTPKYERLCELLEEVFESGEKILVFTSYTRMIDILVRDIRARFKVQTGFIDGRVEVGIRQNIVDRFTAEKDFSALILNPRAAGAGLNITAANHVIHYNLEWNPAVEDQASARAYRRGQTLPVTVHRLFYADTVDEAINDRIARKRDIADTAVVGTTGQSDDIEDILKALRMSPKKG